MGAYSSWASMALVHHALVQYSYWLKDMEQATNASWFDTYLVLGDDVDLAKDPTVASNYQLACADFQVKIGLAKSLSSLSNFFEFANQRLCESGNISPLSFLEELSSQTWNSRVEFASKISKRFGIDMSSTTLIRLVTTARQWQGLIPEYSGLRDAIYTRFLKFILLGPLQPYWHSTI
nr:MAG: RNA-dependent RNA polymerase [Mitovirus sp.]